MGALMLSALLGSTCFCGCCPSHTYSLCVSRDRHSNPLRQTTPTAPLPKNSSFRINNNQDMGKTNLRLYHRCKFWDGLVAGSVGQACLLPGTYSTSPASSLRLFCWVSLSQIWWTTGNSNRSKQPTHQTSSHISRLQVLSATLAQLALCLPPVSTISSPVL